MDVTQAILRRRSIRAYKPKPVPRQLIEEILEVARWTPSGTNAQPWGTVVVSGKAKDELGGALVEAFKLDPAGRAEIKYPPYDGEYIERRRTVGYKVYAAKGIAREDKAKRIWWSEEALRFFGAPVAIILHTRRAFTPYTLTDLGLFAMSIMLVAEEKGLGTCPMKAPGDYPDVLKDRLGIPEDDLISLVITLGYPDLGDPVNCFSRDREPASKFAKFVG